MPTGLHFSSSIDKGFENDLKRMNSQMNNFANETVDNTKKVETGFEGIGDSIKQLAAIGGIAAISSELIGLTKEVYNFRLEVSKLTRLQGDELNEFSADLTATAQTFEQDSSELAISATNFAKGLGISFDEALSEINRGFIEGADGSKQFLDQLKEYSPLLKEAGLDAKQAIDLMTAQVDSGIYSDKGIDAIKEANLRIRELTPATEDAINAIGLSSETIQKALEDGSKSTFDVIQEVSQQLALLPPQSKEVGAALADIFGGPGEDAGIEFIKLLGTMGDEFGDINETLTETQKQEEKLLKTNKELFKAINGAFPDNNPLRELEISAKEAAVYLLENKEIILGIGAALLVYKTSLLAVNKAKQIQNTLTSQATEAESQFLAKSLSDTERKALGITNINKLTAQQIQLIKQRSLQDLESLQIDIQKQQAALSTAAIQGRAAKAEIQAVSLKIQAEKRLLSQAIASKDIVKARAAQQRIANLEDTKAAAVITAKTATTTAASAATKINTLQGKLSVVQTRLQAAADKGAAVAKNVLTKASFALSKGFKSIGAALAGNPIGIAVTAMTFLIPLIKKAVDANNAYSKAIQKFNENVNKQTKTLDDSFGALKEAEKGTDEYKAAIEEINSKYGDYITNLDAEKSSLEDIEKAYKDAKNGLVAYNLEKVKSEYTSKAFQDLLDQERYLLTEINRDFTKFIPDPEIKGKFQAFVNDYVGSIKDIETAFDFGVIEKEFDKLGFQQGVASYEANTQQSVYDLRQSAKEYQKAIADFEKFKSGYLGEISKVQPDLTTDPESEKAAEEQRKKDAESILAEKRKQDAIDAEVRRKEALKALEIRNQSEINAILTHAAQVEEVEKQTQSKLLANKLAYYETLEKLTTDKLEKLKIQEQIIATKSAQAELNPVEGSEAQLNDLLTKYQTYTDKRKAIEKAYAEELTLLRGDQYEKQRELSEKALQAELDQLDDAILSSDKAFQEWLSKTLPKLASDSIDKLEEAVNQIELKLNVEGLDPEQVLVYKEQIDLLKQTIEDKNNSEKEGTDNLKDTLEIMQGVNSLANDISESFGGVNETTRRIIDSISETASGVINVVKSVQLLSEGLKGVEKASAILAVISAAFQVMSALSEAFKASAEAREEAYTRELSSINAINIALIEQNRLYKEGNEFFAEDKWGTTLANLDAYNEALNYQEKVLNEIIQTEGRGLSDKFVKDTSFKETLILQDIVDASEKYETTVEQALAKIAVKTKDRSGFSEFFGVVDQYESLISLYPEVIDGAGNVNATLLETIINSEDLSESQRQSLTNLLDAINLTEESFAQFGDYISSIFGGVGDEISSVFQTMYQEGSDSFEALEESFSGMIEQFTRDAIEFAFLQPYINDLNELTKSLGEDYARGDIDETELQKGITNALGDFYGTVQEQAPKIEEAFAEADRLAASAGFDSAFKTDAQIKDEEDEAARLAAEAARLAASVADHVAAQEARLDAQEIVIPEIATPEILDTYTPSSVAGQITSSITEETGSILSGRMGAMMMSNQIIADQGGEIMMSNQIIADQGGEILEYAVQNLLLLGKIVTNTDRLHEIADNTKKTADRLELI